MKTFLITYTTNDRWEMSEGIVIVNASSRQRAIKQLTFLTTSETVTSIKMLRNSKWQKIVFHQKPTIE